jgi:hypothetical protein
MCELHVGTSVHVIHMCMRSCSSRRVRRTVRSKESKEKCQGVTFMQKRKIKTRQGYY